MLLMRYYFICYLIFVITQRITEHWVICGIPNHVLNAAILVAERWDGSPVLVIIVFLFGRPNNSFQCHLQTKNSHPKGVLSSLLVKTSHADVLRASSCVPLPRTSFVRGTPDEALRTSTLEGMLMSYFLKKKTVTHFALPKGATASKLISPWL